jgi:hypothetical protein
MPPRISVPIEELARLGTRKMRDTLSLAPARPEIPLNVTVLGLKLGFRIQWSKVDGSTGYHIAVMTDNDLAAPKLILTEMGSEAMERGYYIGDVASTRQFSVQAFIDYSGGRVVSEYSVPVEATSVVDGGASDSEPADPPSNPDPETPEAPEFPGGGGGQLR